MSKCQRCGGVVRGPAVVGANEVYCNWTCAALARNGV